MRYKNFIVLYFNFGGGFGRKLPNDKAFPDKRPLIVIVAQQSRIMTSQRGSGIPNLREKFTLYI